VPCTLDDVNIRSNEIFAFVVVCKIVSHFSVVKLFTSDLNLSKMGSREARFLCVNESATLLYPVNYGKKYLSFYSSES
jgi:hypothetical protein